MSTKKPFKTAKSKAAFLLPRKNRAINRFVVRASKMTSTTVDRLHRNKKYEILSDGRVKALKDLKTDKDTVEVPRGTIGGVIDSKRNLSTRGTSWAHTDTAVSKKGRVQGTANVKDGSLVTDKTVVSGNATVFDSSLYDSAVVKGSAHVSHCRVQDKAIITGDSDITDSTVDTKAFIKNVTVHNDSHISGTVVAKTDSTSVLDNVIVKARTRVRPMNDANLTNSVIAQRWAVVFIVETTVGVNVEQNGEVSDIIIPAPESMKRIDEDSAHVSFVGKLLSTGDNKRDIRTEEITVWLSHNSDLRDAMLRTQEEFFPTGTDYLDSVVFQLTQIISDTEKPVYDLGLANKYFRHTTNAYTSKRVAKWVNEPHTDEETSDQVKATTEFISDAGLEKIMPAVQIAGMFEAAFHLIEEENEKASRIKKAQAKKGHATHSRPARGPEQKAA